jgi:hypothetical protein
MVEMPRPTVEWDMSPQTVRLLRAVPTGSTPPVQRFPLRKKLPPKKCKSKDGHGPQVRAAMGCFWDAA